MKKLIVLLFIVSFHLPLCACGEKTAGTVFPTVTQEAEAASEPSMISDVTDVMGTGEVISDIGSAAEVPDEPEASADTETETQSETDADIPSGARPKKYFTICFDDGITQDLKIIEIFKKYGFTSCTFFINTGLYGANWKQVGRMHDRRDRNSRVSAAVMLRCIRLHIRPSRHMTKTPKPSGARWKTTPKTSTELQVCTL